MAGGRPRTVTPSPEEMIELGKEMCKWVSENNPIHLSLWYTMQKDITDNEWNTYRQRPEFVHYYTKALKMVGMNYLNKDSQVDGRIKDRWLRVYFKDLKEEEDETARFLQSLKIEELEKVSPEVLDKFSMLMAQMKQNQDSKDLTNKSTETKS